MIEENIFEIKDFKNLIEYVVNVESDNSEKFSELIKNNVNILFDIDKDCRNLKHLSRKINYGAEMQIDSILSAISELRKKIMLLYDNYEDFYDMIDDFYNDSKIIGKAIEENVGV